MKLTFVYDPAQEVIPLKAGFSSVNNTRRTEFARRAEQTGIDPADAASVAKLSRTMLIEQSIDPQIVVSEYQSKWDSIQQQVIPKLMEMFATDWEPGEVTAYLTVSGRCPYNFPKRFFFVSAFKQTPIATSLHELQHFYAHELLEPLFVAAGKAERFNDFKESLTVLLNERFSDILEKPDAGYEQHEESRKSIVDLCQQGKSLIEIAIGW